jgi:hypothetical protein
MSEDSDDQIITPARMPQFETDEKILNALKRANANSAKLIQIGYALIVLLAILTGCILISFLSAMLSGRVF